MAPRHDDVVETEDTVVVNTPLELIARLERDEFAIHTVVLSGLFASDRVLVHFLGETYPAIKVVAAPHGLVASHGNQAAFSLT
jgi:hypothetical protein